MVLLQASHQVVVGIKRVVDALCVRAHACVSACVRGVSVCVSLFDYFYFVVAYVRSRKLVGVWV